MRADLVLIALFVCLTLPTWFAPSAIVAADGTVDENLKGEKIALQTDTDAINREAQAMSHTGFSTKEKELLSQSAEKHVFQAEVNRLMSLIVNSLYSNKEIFLRELISNASDALDKIRFEAVTDPSVLDTKAELEIRIQPDRENNALHIFDSGIGMTRDDLVNNLGTIAKSGTKEFLTNPENGAESDSLIGQFGVGFYSAFLVAETVVVSSKHNSDDQHVWQSAAELDTAFRVAADPRGNTLGRGTQITLHLKDDASEYLEPSRLRQLVHKYSEFINYPIYLWESHLEEREVPIDEEDFEEDFEEADGDEEEGVHDVEDEEEEDEEDEFEDYEIIEEEVWEWVLINDTSPLWTRDPSEISEEEYNGFYRAITKDSEDPIAYTHFKAEGDVEFRCVLYIPSTPPSNAFETGKDEVRGVKLYVRRVFITDNFDSVIPKYLSFVKGVVDSATLELNVSREILQQGRALRAMEKKVVRKVIGMIQDLAEDDEKYESFYDDYRTFLKLGVIDDSSNRARLAKLLRFTTTSSDGELVSLEQYKENMKEGQDQIFFIAGESEDILSTSPLLETLVSKGYEVLYMTDPLDEYLTGSLTEFDGVKLVNIAKEGDLHLDDEDEENEDEEELAEEFKPLTDFIKKALKKKITKCTVSNRLTRSPSAIVSSGYGYTANMERILKAQALTARQSTFMAPRKVMEINPKHPIILELRSRIEENEEDADATVIAEVLYDTAALNSGFSIDDPADFATRIHRMMSLSLDLDVDLTESDEPEVDIEQLEVEHVEVE